MNKRILSIFDLKNSLWPDWFQEAFSNNLISVFLHGNCLMAGFSPIKEPWQISFILKEDSPEKISGLKLLVKKATQQGITFGYFFTRESLTHSADVFPLELLHIAKRNEVLFGEQPLANYTPNHNALRLECERELRGILIHLRREFVYMQQGHTQMDFFFLAEAQLMPILYGVYFLLHNTYPETHEAIFAEYPQLRIEPPTREEEVINERANKYILTITQIINTIDSMEIQ